MFTTQVGNRHARVQARVPRPGDDLDAELADLNAKDVEGLARSAGVLRG